MIVFLSFRILSGLRKNSYLLFFIGLSCMGMAIGTACLLLIMAFMNGAQDMIKKRYAASMPHLLIQPDAGGTLDDIPGTLQRLQALRGVARAERRLTLPALAEDWFGDICGTDGTVSTRIPFGSVGDRVRLMLPILNLTPIGLAPSDLILEKESDGGAADRIEIPLIRLQQALGLQGKISDYALYLTDAGSAGILSGRLGALLPPGARVRTFAQLNAPLFLALALEKWLMFAGVGLVLLVSFLQLYQSFSLLVLHHEVTWATLQALGASPRALHGIFALVALAISLGGGVVGLATALLLGHWQNTRHILPFPQPLSHLGYVPLVFDRGMTLSIVALLTVFSLMVAFPSARKAAALSISQVLYAPE